MLIMDCDKTGNANRRVEWHNFQLLWKLVWATLNNTFNDILKTSTRLYERHTLVKVDKWPMVIMGVMAHHGS